MTVPCTKEKQIDKIEKIAEKNNDCVISLQKDVTYIRQAVTDIKSSHLKRIDKKLDNLSDNYIVFKTRVIVGWSLAVIIISIVTNKLLESYL